MPMLLALLTTSVAGLFGVSQVMDKTEDASSEMQTNALYIGGIMLIGIGGYLVYKQGK